jgi:hypothetical protein
MEESEEILAPKSGHNETGRGMRRPVDWCIRNCWARGRLKMQMCDAVALSIVELRESGLAPREAGSHATFGYLGCVFEKNLGI